MPEGNASIEITARNQGAKSAIEQTSAALRGVGAAATKGAGEASRAFEGMASKAVIQEQKVTALSRKILQFEQSTARLGRSGIDRLVDRQTQAVAASQALGGKQEEFQRIVIATNRALERQEAAFAKLSDSGRKSIERLFTDTAKQAKLGQEEMEKLAATFTKLKAAAAAKDAAPGVRAQTQAAGNVVQQAQEQAKAALLQKRTGEDLLNVEEKLAIARARAAGASKQQIDAITGAYGIQRRAAAEAAAADKTQQRIRAQEQAKAAVEKQTQALERQAAVAGKAGAERVAVERRIASEQAKAAGASVSQLQRISRSYDQLEAAAKRGGGAVRSSGESFAAAALETAALTAGIKTLIVDTATYGARVQTQGVALQQVARQNGVAAEAVDKQTEALKRLGISTEAAQKTLAQFITGGLPIERIQELAGLSRDLAVIMGEDTSDAMTRLTRAIITQEIEILRTLGLNIKFEDGLNRMARSLGKLPADLTFTERALANFNSVVGQAPRFMGTYEASMLTVGKQMTTLTRLVNESKLALSEAFLPALGTVVGAITDATKHVREHAEGYRQLAAVIGVAGTALAAWRTANLLQLAVFGASKGWIGLTIAGLTAIGAAYLATRKEVDVLRDSMGRSLEGIKEQREALRGAGLSAKDLAEALASLDRQESIIKTKETILDLEEATKAAARELQYYKFRLIETGNNPATLALLDKFKDKSLDLRTALLAARSELERLQAPPKGDDSSGANGDELSKKIQKDLEEARKLYETARRSELSTAERIRDILRERIKELGSSAQAIDLVGRTAAIELRAEVNRMADEMRKGLENFGHIAQDEAAKAFTERLAAEEEVNEALTRTRLQSIEQAAQIESQRIARSRDLALAGLRDTADLSITEKLRAETEKLAIEVNFLERSGALEADAIRRNTALAVHDHEVRLALIVAETDARIAGLRAQEAAALAAARGRSAAAPELQAIGEAFAAARTAAQGARAKQMEGIREITAELLTQEARALETLSEQTGDAVLTAQRQTAAQQADLLASHNQRVFDQLKRSAEGVFDSLTRSSEGFFQNLANIMKTAMLTAIKEIVTSRVALALTELFGGGRFGVQTTSGGGRGGGGGLLSLLLGGAGIGGIGRPGAPGGTGGFTGPVTQGGGSALAAGAAISLATAARGREVEAAARANEAQRESIALTVERSEAERDAAARAAEAARERIAATEELSAAQGRQAQEFDASARRQERAALALGQRLTGLLGSGGVSGAVAAAGLPAALGSGRFGLQSILAPFIGSVSRPGAPGGTGGFAGPVGGQGGLGGLFTGFGQQAAGLREFLNLGSSIQLGPGLATTFEAATALQKFQGVLRSNAAALAGGLLAFNGLRQGGVGGLAQTAAGGALIGFKFGGPIGALIGGGIGAAAGFVRLFVKGAEDKAREKIRSAYGLNVTDRQVLKQVVETARSGFGGNIDLAIRSPQVKELLTLYAMHRGEQFNDPSAKAPPFSAVQRGGAIFQAPSFSNGRPQILESSLPTLSTGTRSSGGGAVVFQLDGAATTSLLRGEAVDLLENSPRIVQNAALKSARGQFGRRQMAALNMEPQVLER